MPLLFANNAETTLSVAAFLGDTTLTAASDGSANMFRSPQLSGSSYAYQLATLTHPDYPGAYEVVRIFNRVDNVFAVDRGVETVYGGDPEGITAQGAARAWPVGTKLSARVTEGTLRSFASAAESEARIALQKYPKFIAHPDAYMDENILFSSVGATFFVDLGVPTKTFAPSGSQTVLGRSDVVVPATPNGFQYRVEIDELSEFNLYLTTGEPNWSNLDPTTGAIEGTVYGSQVGRDITYRLRPTAMPVNFGQELISFEGKIVLTEVGFIAYAVTATTPPSVSIGTDVNQSLFASNVGLTQITGSSGVHRIPITTGGELVTKLHYKVDTAATGGSFVGRFYWRGFLVAV